MSHLVILVLSTLAREEAVLTHVKVEAFETPERANEFNVIQT